MMLTIHWEALGHQFHQSLAIREPFVIVFVTLWTVEKSKEAPAVLALSLLLEKLYDSGKRVECPCFLIPVVAFYCALVVQVYSCFLLVVLKLGSTGHSANQPILADNG